MALRALAAKTAASLDANTLPAVGGVGIAGFLPYAVAYLYAKVPGMAEFAPETAFLSFVIGAASFLMAKADLRWSSSNWAVKA